MNDLACSRPSLVHHVRPVEGPSPAPSPVVALRAHAPVRQDAWDPQAPAHRPKLVVRTGEANATSAPHAVRATELRTVSNDGAAKVERYFERVVQRLESQPLLDAGFLGVDDLMTRQEINALKCMITERYGDAVEVRRVDVAGSSGAIYSHLRIAKRG